ncbi:cytochrome c oxidase cbb3-type subunit 4 [Rhodospirillales bacterium URHD0017]|nr:cytochrome c oxidase cbb3-type subunit 4 [Rhodospirillales bacterium URHD0017]
MLHDNLVWLAKSAGLFYLVALSIVIVAWVYWPSNKKRYDRAAAAILQDDDRPLP